LAPVRATERLQVAASGPSIRAVAVMAPPDGRRLAYEVMGDPAGFPVMVLHGTPGSSRQLAGLDELARDRGVAVIAPDRAGYDGSSHDPSRTTALGVRDLGELIGPWGQKPALSWVFRAAGRQRLCAARS